MYLKDQRSKHNTGQNIFKSIRDKLSIFSYFLIHNNKLSPFFYSALLILDMMFLLIIPAEVLVNFFFQKT